MTIRPTISATLLNPSLITAELKASRNTLVGKASARACRIQAKMADIAGKVLGPSRAQALAAASRELGPVLTLQSLIASDRVCEQIADQVVSIAQEWQNGDIEEGPEIRFEGNYKLVMQVDPTGKLVAAVNLVDDLFMESAAASPRLRAQVVVSELGDRAHLIGPHVIENGLTVKINSVNGGEELIRTHLGNHPFLPTYYPIHMDHLTKTPGIILTYCPDTLSSVFENRTSLTNEQICQLVNGVAYLHEKGVVINTLRVESLRLDEKGNLKLDDLKACLAPEVTSEQPPKYLHEIAGNPSTTSPEGLLARFSYPFQALDESGYAEVEADPQSNLMHYCELQDAFALGCIFWRSIKGPTEYDLLTSLYPQMIFNLWEQIIEAQDDEAYSRICKRASPIATECVKTYTTWWQEEVKKAANFPLRRIVLGLLNPSFHQRLLAKEAAVFISAILEPETSSQPSC